MQQLEKPRLDFTHAGQGLKLVGEQGCGQARVGDRVIDAFPDQFVVFDEAMIWVFWKGDRRKDQGIDDRKAEQRMAWRGLAQHAQVVSNQVVTENATGGPGESGQFVERPRHGKVAGARERFRP